MWIPDHFRESDLELIAEFIRNCEFGTLITFTTGETRVSHIPLRLLDGGDILVGHIAMENPQSAHIRAQRPATIIFLGPNGYISPHWYRQPNVPTWNYAAVHVHGNVAPRATDGLLEDLEALARKHEPPDKFTTGIISADLRDNLLSLIQGFELKAVKIEAQFKLSQNHPADLARIMKALARHGQRERELAEFMASFYERKNKGTAGRGQ